MNLIALGNAGRITSLGMAAVASLYLWWAGPVLVTAWLVTRLINHSRKGPDTASTGQAQRRANYYYEICVDAPAAKEVRVFDLASWASSKFTRHRTLLADERISQASLGGGRIALSLIVLVVTYMAVFASFAQRVSAGSMSASELTVAALASLAVAGLGFGGADWVYDQCSGVTAALERVERECRADPGDAQGLGETVSGPSGAKLNDNIRATGPHFLEVLSVTYSYPGSDRQVLSGVSLRVEQGETIAIVGANGSGKTTLAKLLCGLLSPTGGEVIVDGLPVTHVEASGHRSMQTVVFQDFAKYDWTLAENVAPLGAADEQSVRVSLSQTGFPDSVAVDTPLGSGYPGARDLSGGQWQRVAVARTLQKVHEGVWLVMLDEPTAQMDIEGEVEVFQNITDATKECATILISHRFPTVRQAARIYVLANGEIAETGSHDDLMKRNGIYREMFDLQASGFRDDSE